MDKELIFERLPSSEGGGSMSSKKLSGLVTLFVATEIYRKADQESYEEAAEAISYGIAHTHAGDCTGMPYTCLSCYADDYIEMARRFIKEIPLHD